MTRYIAFLRAVNVGGRVVTMKALREIFESLDLDDVTTFIASGNVIFSSDEEPEPLHDRIETALRESLGYEVTVFLRTGPEVAAAAESVPFAEEELAEARALVVGFLREPLTSAQKKALLKFETKVDAFRTHGRELYWLIRVKQSESKIALAAIERTLGARSTFRSITTVKKLGVKYGGME